MSHYMTALAMKQRGLPPYSKILLYWLADHHNAETNKCFPSLSRLSKLCEISKRSVQNHLQNLKACGLISVEHSYRDDGQQTSNNYLLHLSDEGVQDMLGGDAEYATPGVQDLPANNLGSNNPGREIVLVRNIEQTIADFEEWWKVYPRKVGKYKASPAFAKACHITNFDELMEATKRFAKACEGQDKQFIPHPTTWLNQQRWNDDISSKVVNIQSAVLKDMGLSYE